MDLPFKITLKCGLRRDDTWIDSYILNFESELNLQNLQVDQIPALKEQLPLSLQFEGDLNAKLYFSELNDYDILDRVKDENGEYYILPREQDYEIFGYSHQNIPLIPGIYYVSVVYEESTYYSSFQIIPKDLTISEWKSIKQDLEDKIRGLSSDFKRRELITSTINKKVKNKQSYFDKVPILVEQIPKLTFILNEIAKNPKSNINKDYTWIPRSKGGDIDFQTIQMAQRFPEKVEYVYSYKRYLDFDIAENRYLKFMLDDIRKFCKEASDFLEELIGELTNEYNKQSRYTGKRNSEKVFLEKEYIKRKRELEFQLNSVASFHNYLMEYTNQDWMLKVKRVLPKHVPKAIVLNSKYNNIYKLYLKLLKYTSEDNLLSDYRYYWKRTDVLYEMWVYTTTIDLLIDSGYEPISGWIFDDTYTTILPFLREGTRIVLRKDGIDLHIIYNEEIPDIKIVNTKDFPIKTSSTNRKPDIRIDIWINKNYGGAIMLDAKYKPLGNIIGRDSTEQVNQLQNYRNGAFSTVFAVPDQLQRQIRVTQSVFALYPTDRKTASEKTLRGFSEQEIHFNMIRPNIGYSDYMTALLNQIEERVQTIYGLRDY